MGLKSSISSVDMSLPSVPLIYWVNSSPATRGLRARRRHSSKGVSRLREGSGRVELDNPTELIGGDDEVESKFFYIY
jgi:hypothetical protein